MSNAAPDERGDEAVMRAWVDHLIAAASVEMTPREVLKRTVRPGLVAGSRVYLTHLPQTSTDQLVEAATRIRGWDLSPVPHLAVRSLDSVEQAEGLVGQLVQRAGVDDVLVIAGSVATVSGPFGASIEFLQSGILQAHGVRRVGVAGHPEGSPDITADELALALGQKNDFALQSGLELRLVTQFCFDPVAVLEWEQAIRDAGNRLPIHVGLAGLASPSKLIKFGISCGIGPSLKVLRKQAGSVFKLATTAHYQPSEVVGGLAGYGDPNSAIQALHFFPFGAVDETIGWIRAVQDGNYAVDPQSSSFEVMAPA